VGANVAKLKAAGTESVVLFPASRLGTEEGMAERLLAIRERLGFTYFAVFQRDVAAFAPVLARLRSIEASARPR
jgi:hypothetical protein